MQKPGCFPPRTPGAPGLGQSLCSGTEHRALGKESLFWKGSVALRGPLCPGCCMIHLGLMLLEPPQESVRRVPAWGSETEQTRRAPDLGGGLGLPGQELYARHYQLRCPFLGNSLVVQWLGLGPSTAGGRASISVWGIKILHAVMCSQKQNCCPLVND